MQLLFVSQESSQYDFFGSHTLGDKVDAGAIGYNSIVVKQCCLHNGEEKVDLTGMTDLPAPESFGLKNRVACHAPVCRVWQLHPWVNLAAAASARRKFRTACARSRRILPCSADWAMPNDLSCPNIPYPGYGTCATARNNKKFLWHTKISSIVALLSKLALQKKPKPFTAIILWGQQVLISTCRVENQGSNIN